MNQPELKPSERHDETLAAAVLELRYLEGVGGVAWGRIAPYMAPAEPVVFLRIEREQALRSGRPFDRQEELQRAEDALRVINAFRLMVGARTIDRIVELARNKEAWFTVVLELRYLENAGGALWSVIAESVAEAEPVVLLRIEREEALRCSRPFDKQDELRRSEEALARVNLFRRFVGARVVERMVQLAGSLEEEPRSRFSDTAIVWVFSHLHWWEIPG